MDRAVIDLQQVSIYQHKNLVLSNVTLRVNKGEFIYLIGKTGSGKSTLLQLLYAELPLKHGSGMVAGYDLRTLKSNQVPFLRRKLGIIFQDFQLLTDRNVKENLVFVLKATGWTDDQKINNRVNEVLEKVSLSTKGFKMPHQLSGGEQQRLVIARALLNEPELLIADEPTGNLDPETSNGIMQLLFEIATGGRSVIMATHNYSLIERFPARIIKAENGVLSEYHV